MKIMMASIILLGCIQLYSVVRETLTCNKSCEILEILRNGKSKGLNSFEIRKNRRNKYCKIMILKLEILNGLCIELYTESSSTNIFR